jgi:hypothetical protein
MASEGKYRSSVELQHAHSVTYAKAKRGRGSQNTNNMVVEPLLGRRHVSALLLGHHQVLKIQIGGELYRVGR